LEEAVILSHRKDADGISSAALLRALTKGKVYLADYGEMISTISEIRPAKDVYISDLGLNSSMFDSFESELKRLASSGMVHYIDHHPIKQEFFDRLTDLGVDMFHSQEESAAMLVYKKFQSQLENDTNMKLLACCGAITDYLDEQPLAKKLISTFDRQFLLYEATVLSFSIAIVGRRGVAGVPKLIGFVNDLSDGRRLPHQIEGAAEFAKQFATQSSELIQKVKAKGKRMTNFAYFKTDESSTGNIANFLIGAFNVPVGVAFRAEEPGFLEVSARGSDECSADLGKIIGKIANDLGNPGGGHRRAAGARIREDQFDTFLRMFDSSLSEQMSESKSPQTPSPQ
jgi:oligoribonuclease NrnB/cAMP/cGMP phosphodiesterase (DHH superfamily)